MAAAEDFAALAQFADVSATNSEPIARNAHPPGHLRAVVMVAVAAPARRGRIERPRSVRIDDHDRRWSR